MNVIGKSEVLRLYQYGIINMHAHICCTWFWIIPKHWTDSFSLQNIDVMLRHDMTTFSNMNGRLFAVINLLLHVIYGYTSQYRSCRCSTLYTNYRLPAKIRCDRSWTEQLLLCRCGLTGVSEQAFYCLSSLKTLDMSKNRLHRLPSRTLHPLLCLEELNLAGTLYTKKVLIWNVGFQATNISV